MELLLRDAKSVAVPWRGAAVLSQSLPYRADIDGLRAVAVSSVMVYHAVPAWLPGGFAGVDVFFVISGYLITQLIGSELQRGAFSVRGFYARRIRRILPALVLVVPACGLFGWLVLTPNELRWFGKSMGWGAAFLGNAFLATSGGYFEDAIYLNPLLHLWSLAVEEQFYLLWPLLLLIAGKQGATRPAVIAVMASSFAISVWAALAAPIDHFYLLSCRAWELALGGMLAVRGGVGSGPVKASYTQLLSSLGMMLVIGSALFLTPDRAFPRWWSLAPTAGAALLIAAGREAWMNRCVLGRPGMIFVGRISYSLYLWHWPMLAFTRIVLGRALPWALAACVLAAAFAAACISYYLVECPIRYGRAGGKAVPALLVALSAVTLTGVAFSRGWISARLSGATVEELDRARHDWAYPRRFSLPISSGFEVLTVASRRSRKVIFIGDSHVQQYLPRIEYLAGSHPDTARSAELATYIGCPPLPGVNTPTRGSACDRFLDFALQRARRSEVDTVVFGAFWEAYLIDEFSTDHRRHPLYSTSDPLRTPLDLDSSRTRIALDAFQRVVSQLVASGRRVFIILPNPTSPQLDPTSMLAAARLRASSSATVAIDADRHLVDAGPFEAFVAPITARLQQIAAQSGARALDPRESLCAGMLCPAASAGGQPLYKDSNHLRPFFARERATFLDEVLLGPAARTRISQ